MIPQEKFDIDRRLFPFESHWLRLENGAVMHYVDEGSGPVLLLLHGNPTWSFLYRNIIPRLTEKFRVIAPDYPGFGLSTAPSGYRFTAAEQARATAEFVEALGIANMILMVQDWGGPIGFAVAQEMPSRIDGFVIGNTWAWPLERIGQKVFSLVMGGPIGRFMARCCNGIVYVFMTRGVVAPLDRAVFEMYRAPFEDVWSREPTHIFPRQLLAAKRFLSGVYKAMPVLKQKRALILWGTQDFAFQEPERTRFEQLFMNHKTVLLSDAGHFIQEDAPDEIVREILDWHASKP